MPPTDPRESSVGSDRERGGGEAKEVEAAAAAAAARHPQTDSDNGEEGSATRTTTGPTDEAEAVVKCPEGVGATKDGFDSKEEPACPLGKIEGVAAVSPPATTGTITSNAKPPRMMSKGVGRVNRRLLHFRRFHTANDAENTKVEDATLRDSRTIRTVATANDIADDTCNGGDSGTPAADPTDRCQDAAAHINTSNPNPTKPIRLVQSLTSSLARYRSPAHTITFSPSEESVLVTVVRTTTSPENATPFIASPGARDDNPEEDDLAGITTSVSGTATASETMSSSELTNGASDSTLSSHFVVTKTLENDLTSEEVEVVVCAVGIGSGPSEVPPSPPSVETTTTSTNGTTMYDSDHAKDEPWKMVNRTVVFAATTPRGGTIELVGPTDSDVPEAVPSSDSQECDTDEAEPGFGVVCVGKTAEEQPEGDDGVGANTAMAWALNSCTANTAAHSHDEEMVPSPPFIGTPLRPEVTNDLRSNYCSWSMFRPRESIAVDVPDADTVKRSANEMEGVGRAEERFLNLVKDAAALVHGHEEQAVDGHIDGPVHRGAGSPNSSEPFTEGQSRVLASLYARTNKSANSKDTTETEKPWENPTSVLRPTSTTATAKNEEKSSQSRRLPCDPNPRAPSQSKPPSGRGKSMGLVRLARRNHPEQKALSSHSMSSHAVRSGIHATSAATTDVTAEIQEVTSLQSESQFSLPKNLLQFDFVLSSDLSSSYYGSSGAETRSSVLSSHEADSKESRNESTASIDDSGMKRSSCDSSDHSGSSGSMSSQLSASSAGGKDNGTSGSNQPQCVAEQGSMSSIENVVLGEAKDPTNVEKVGGEVSADNGLKANDSSTVEVVRYRVALGPIKFSYYARGRKKR